jgi:hypothetical protein
MARFLKILATRPFDLRQAEEQRDYVRLSASTFVQDDPEWRDTQHSQPHGAASARVA